MPVQPFTIYCAMCGGRRQFAAVQAGAPCGSCGYLALEWEAKFREDQQLTRGQRTTAALPLSAGPTEGVTLDG